MKSFEDRIDRELEDLRLSPALREEILHRAAQKPGLLTRLGHFLNREVEIPLAPAAAVCAAAVLAVTVWTGRLVLSPEQQSQNQIRLVVREGGYPYETNDPSA